MKHFRYLRYVIIHKWFVLLACWRRGLWWQGIIHDWSKFLPSEWFAYADFFYGFKPTDNDRSRAIAVLGYDPYPSHQTIADRRFAFDVAWLKHQHRSPHHWQHWVLREDSGATLTLEMPKRYAMEMICDWEGAGRAITGRSGETASWYQKNRSKILLQSNTRALVERELKVPPADEAPGIGVAPSLPRRPFCVQCNREIRRDEFSRQVFQQHVCEACFEKLSAPMPTPDPS